MGGPYCPNLARVKRRLAIATILAAGLAAVPAQPASAGHTSKSCGIVSRGSADYRVEARVISCRSAKTWVKRYLKRRAKPSGWDCTDPPGSIRVYCSRATKAYWTIRL
jgi:hypothetical protein